MRDMRLDESWTWSNLGPPQRQSPARAAPGRPAGRRPTATRSPGTPGPARPSGAMRPGRPAGAWSVSRRRRQTGKDGGVSADVCVGTVYLLRGISCVYGGSVVFERLPYYGRSNIQTRALKTEVEKVSM